MNEDVSEIPSEKFNNYSENLNDSQFLGISAGEKMAEKKLFDDAGSSPISAREKKQEQSNKDEKKKKKFNAKQMFMKFMSSVKTQISINSR